jgi:hypothetical protein
MARQYSSISQETTLTADLSASTSSVTVNVQSGGAANLMGGITLQVVTPLLQSLTLIQPMKKLFMLLQSLVTH